MRRSTLRTAVAVVTAGLTLTACGGSDDGGVRGRRRRPTPPPRPRPRTSAAWTPSIEAAQEEGTLNVIALPAGLGELRRDARHLQREVRHRDQQRQPRRLQPGRAQRRHQPARPGPRPRRPRPRHQLRPQQAPAQDLLAPVPGRDLGRDPRGPEGPRRPLVQRLRRLHLHRLQRLGDRRVPDDASPDLLDPQYEGQVALNGNPTQAAAAFSGVWAAALANGGSLDDIGPGIDFFAAAQGGRQLQPGRDHPGDDPERRDPDRDRLGLPQRRPHRDPRRARASTGRSPSPATACSAATTARRSASSPRTRPRRGCGRSSSTATRARTSG